MREETPAPVEPIHEVGDLKSWISGIVAEDRIVDFGESLVCIDMRGDEIRIRDAVIVHEKNELTRCMFEAIVPAAAGPRLTCLIYVTSGPRLSLC